MKKWIGILVGASLFSGVLAQTAPGTIVEVAAGNKSFSTLVAAVKTAGLVETLSGAGPFTVFAPTDEAFAKLPAGTVEELVKPENKEKLTAILTYHVLAGKVMAADAIAADGKMVKTSMVKRSPSRSKMGKS